MPVDFAETSTGLLLLADGINQPRRWDSLASTFEEAGLIAPTTATTLGNGTGGNGVIVGDYYAYVRFVDKDGLFSNLSPISALFSAQQTGPLTITLALNTAPIRIKVAGHGLTTGDYVNITGCAGNTAANGTWQVTVINANRFDLDGSVGNGDYKGGGTMSTGHDSIDYTGVPVSTESRVTRRQILRNTAGQTQTFYIDVDTTDLTSTTFTTTNSDSQLAAGTAVPLFQVNGDDFAISYHSRPPNDRRFLANHIDRMFAAGIRDFTTGSVAVTNGSPNVTGIGTNPSRSTESFAHRWTSQMVGRQIFVVGGDKPYSISSVDAPNQTLVLTENYGGTTNAYADYSIRPASSTQRTVYFSESGLPESWPPTNALTLQQERDSENITGIMPLGSFLYILEERNIFRFTYQTDPGRDGDVFLTRARRGCVNNRSWVLLEDSAYMLDRAGVHQFTGSDSQPISVPIQDLFDPNSQEEFKLNFRAEEWFHAVLDKQAETIRWFVAIAGDYLPRHAICFDYRTQRWWIEEYPHAIGCSVNALVDTTPHVMYGSEFNKIFSHSGRTDGPSPGSGTVRGTVSSATPDSLVDSSASFPSSGIVNSPIDIVLGKGKGQRRRIVSVSGTTLRLDLPWNSLPDTTSTYQIGGIKWSYRAGTYRVLGKQARQERHNRRGLDVAYQPTDEAGTFDMRIYFDRSSTPANAGRNTSLAEGNGVQSTTGDPDLVADLSKDLGFVQSSFPQHGDVYADRQRFVTPELRGVSNQEEVKVYQMTLHGVR